MKSDFRRRIEMIEEQFPTATATADDGARDIAFAVAMDFVEDHGGRVGIESWAEAMARILSVSTSALLSSLSDNGRSRYQIGSENRP